MGKEATEAALTGTPNDPKLAAALKLVETITRYPDDVSSKHVNRLRALGVSDTGICDVIVICAGFNIIDRVADALGFEVPPPDEFKKGARFLLMYGYRFTSGVWPRIRRHRSLGNDATFAERYEADLQDLLDSVLSEEGYLDSTTRKKISLAETVDEPLESYTSKVRHCAYSIANADIDRLFNAGYSEDQVFESTISAALGAGLSRMQKALSAAGFNSQVLSCWAYGQ